MPGEAALGEARSDRDQSFIMAESVLTQSRKKGPEAGI
jgi:hypothetical protein